MSQYNDMDITSANATAVLVAQGVFDTGIVLQKYATDQSVTQAEAQFTESRMGVDGHMATGWTPAPRAVTIMFEANSESIASIEEIIDTQQRLKRPVKLTLVLTVPSIGREYTYTQGALKSGTDGVQLKKMLDPFTFNFDFGRIERSNIRTTNA